MSDIMMLSCQSTDNLGYPAFKPFLDRISTSVQVIDLLVEDKIL